MLKAGKYFIGDPCYVVKDELWNEFCDKSFATKDGYFEIAGVKVFVSGTMHGDGYYGDTRGRYGFPVDAGIIGATPIDSRIIKEDYDESLGAVIDIRSNFQCSLVDEDGFIIIHDLVIPTDYDEDEEDEEDDY